MKPLLIYHPGDQLVLKKPHPCVKRSHHFLVVKIGADIKVKCLGCGTLLMMTRDHLNHKIKEIITGQPDTQTPIK
jgi:hypothetical protein